ncbi:MULTISPECIES: glycoside hydrolase family 88 protein [Paenibacillus]|uniref:glycoside hydrolase family 88 protein n=1 Tax=Paenibacillus TaxID=44249 RepID=UPI002116B4D1|nr:glycoside hydrolase family 88 protein [Paenibacillus odorifer]
MNQEHFKRAAEFVLERMDRSLIMLDGQFPAAASRGLIYEGTGNVDWTPGFWTGMLWLAYELTEDEKYRNAAEAQLASFKRRVEEQIETNTHDLGFLYSLSAVAAYRLTGSEEAKAMALQAADLLTERYFPKAGIIQAWGDLNDPEECGRMIMDCLMNLPLLYWATEVTGDARYADMARSHAKQSAAYLVRPDHTSYHTYYMDVLTGGPKYGNTHQGYSDDSCWARGQAWGMYGFLLSYLYTKEASFIEVSKVLSDYFLSRLPGDGIVYWDLIFTEESGQEKDSSASAIAVCGLLELVKQLSPEDPDRERYEAAALAMMESLSLKYTTEDHPESNGILKHAVYNKPRGWGIDECNLWGDYFYLEALVRLLKDWRPYW